MTQVTGTRLEKSAEKNRPELGLSYQSHNCNIYSLTMALNSCLLTVFFLYINSKGRLCIFALPSLHKIPLFYRHFILLSYRFHQLLSILGQK